MSANSERRREDERGPSGGKQSAWGSVRDAEG